MALPNIYKLIKQEHTSENPHAQDTKEAIGICEFPPTHEQQPSVVLLHSAAFDPHLLQPVGLAAFHSRLQRAVVEDRVTSKATQLGHQALRA